MTRRTFLAALPVGAAALAFRPQPAASQDMEWVRAWERTQTRKPSTLSSSSRIAPVGEPGTPLVIHGHVFQRDGRTPARGITVFAYQTDERGHYDEPGKGPHSWRLQGWALTDAAGAFEFQTIRPARYPSRAVAAHVHFTIEGPDVPRRGAPDLQFQDDDLIGREERAASDMEGSFGGVRPVERRGNTQHVEFNIRIADRNLF